jgi:hypothetical protein
MSAIATPIERWHAKSLSNARTPRGTVFADFIDERRSNAAMQE